MNVSDFVYGTNDLIDVVEDLRNNTLPNFLLDLWFPDEDMQETEAIMFDRIQTDISIAPFVSPLAKAKARAREGYTTDMFKPAYVKLLDLLTPGELTSRLPGEPLNGALSAEQRALAHIGNILRDQRNAVRRRLAVMAAEIARTGAVTIAGDDYPAVTVDYGRTSSLTKALTTTARWGESGVDPDTDLEAWFDEFGEANGSAVEDVVFEKKAWTLYAKSTGLKDKLDRTHGQQLMMDLGYGHNVPGRPTYKGTDGQARYWVYNAKYKDTDGTTKTLLPDYAVAMSAKSVVQGVKAFGLIKDFKSLNALDIFSKTWEEENPSSLQILSQSAPLLVPRRPDGIMFATVR